MRSRCYRSILNFIFSIILFGTFQVQQSNADTGCDLSSITYRGCESLLIQGQSGFKKIIRAFSGYQRVTTDPLKVTKTLVAPLFFKGASYFGLFQSERSPTLRCEYALRGQDALNAFSRSALAFVQNNPDAEVQAWLMRQMIYSGEFAKVRNCLLPGATFYQLEEIIKTSVAQQLDGMMSSPSQREQTFSPIFDKMKSILSITSDILGKIQTFKIELESVDRQIADSPQKGTTTTRFDEFSLDASIKNEKLDQRHTAWKKELNALPDIETLSKQRKEIIGRNHLQGNLLLAQSDLLEKYTQDLFKLNSVFHQSKLDEKGNVSFYLQNIQSVLESKGKIYSILKTYPKTKQACNNPTTQFFYCKDP